MQKDEEMFRQKINKSQEKTSDIDDDVRRSEFKIERNRLGKSTRKLEDSYEFKLEEQKMN